MSKNVRKLDIIRGVAALCVVIGHGRAITFEDYAGRGLGIEAPFYVATGLGYAAVAIFFVLSGFLVGGSVLRKRTKFDLRSYARDRITRIAIVAYPAIALSVAVWAFIGGLGTSITATAPRVIPDSEGWSFSWLVLSNAVFIQPNISPALTTNGSLWSLGYEMQIYVAFPLLIVGWSRRGYWRPAAVFGILLYVVLLLPREGELLLFLWLMGAAAAVLPAARLDRVPFAACATLLASMTVLSSLWPSSSLGVLAVGLATVVTVRSVWSSDDASSTKRRGVLVKAGERSFSIYAYHLPSMLLIACLGAALDKPLRGYPGFVLLVSSSLVISIGLYELTEKHTSTLRRRLSRLDQ